MKKEIEVLARGVIIKEDKMLLCKNKEKSYYYLPGGHIKFNERAEEALSRELKEELSLETEKFSFIGAVEHFYNKKGKDYHEINLVFNVKAKEIREESREDHISFEPLSKEEIEEKEVLPKILKEKVLKWLEDKNTFWT